MNNFLVNNENLKKVPNYQGQWDDYCNISRNFRFFGIGTFVFFFIFQYLNDLLQIPFYFLFLLVISGAVVVFYASKLRNWECPQCLEKFHTENSGKAQIFSKQCVNCNLPQYEGSIYKK